jgi:hypothetical protein
MTVSERVSIEAHALRLGWAMAIHSDDVYTTTFSQSTGCRIVVGWSDNGVAARAERIRADGVVLLAKSWVPDGVEVGRWVRAELELGSRDTTLFAEELARVAADDGAAWDRAHDRSVDEQIGEC